MAWCTHRQQGCRIITEPCCKHTLLSMLREILEPRYTAITTPLKSIERSMVAAMLASGLDTIVLWAWMERCEAPAAAAATASPAHIKGTRNAPTDSRLELALLGCTPSV